MGTTGIALVVYRPRRLGNIRCSLRLVGLWAFELPNEGASPVAPLRRSFALCYSSLLSGIV